MAAGRFGSTKLPMLLGAAAMALTLLAMLVVSPSLKSGTPTELIGGMDFAGGIPPEGVLDDMMNNVDPSDPYGGPVWGLQSGDIGMGEYQARPQQLWNFQQGVQHKEMEPLAVGNNNYGPPPSYEATLPQEKARQMKLWGFNMGYEHHEQPPIFFGPGARSNQQVQLAQQQSGARMMSLASPSMTAAEKAKKQQLWGWNMQYEHHEMPPIYFGPGARNNNAEEVTAEMKDQAAREMQLWGWNMGYEHHEPTPPSMFPAKANTASKTQQLAAAPQAAGNAAAKARQMKLWGFNMGYEHHEMPPIYFGPSARNNNVQVASAELKDQAAREMQLWGWNMGYEHHEPTPPSMFPAKANAPAKQQQLWMWNMGYEHHEPTPPSMYPARANTAAAQQQLKTAPGKQQQLWMWNMGYEHHEPQPPSMWAAKAPAPMPAPL